MLTEKVLGHQRDAGMVHGDKDRVPHLLVCLSGVRDGYASLHKVLQLLLGYLQELASVSDAFTYICHSTIYCGFCKDR